MIFRFSSIKTRIKKGFTLVELLVTITIFVILTGVVLFSQNRFNSTIFLTNLAYDVALTVRQAQTYGVNIKNFVTFSESNFTDNFIPYGVHFETSSPTSFILFADLDATTQNNKVISDGIFDGRNETLIDPSTCDINDGCVKRFTIQRGNRIKQLCVSDVGGDEDINWSCSSSSVLDIVFVRPNPDALITADGVRKRFAKIILTDGNDGADENTREVKVQFNGLVFVKNR